MSIPQPRAVHRLVFPVIGIGVAAALTYFDKMSGWSFVAGLAVVTAGYYVEGFFAGQR